MPGSLLCARNMMMWLKSFFHLTLEGSLHTPTPTPTPTHTHTHTPHTCRYKANNSDAGGMLEQLCRKALPKWLLGQRLEWREEWALSIWGTLYQWQEMVSAEAGQRNSRENCHQRDYVSKWVEDIGSERCSKDFDNLFSFPTILCWSSESQLSV